MKKRLKQLLGFRFSIFLIDHCGNNIRDTAVHTHTHTDRQTDTYTHTHTQIHIHVAICLRFKFTIENECRELREGEDNER